MSTKPVLLLDFDGVINCTATFPKIPGTEDRTAPKMLCNLWPHHTWRRIVWPLNGEEWPIQWSTEVVRSIRAVHTDGAVEIRWHSTWQDNIADLAEAMGLPAFEVHPAPEVDMYWGLLSATLMARGKPGWWKYPAAERVLLEEGRPLIWADDDLTGQVTRAYRDKMGQMGPFLPLSPDEATGLTPRHFRLLGQFVDRLGVEG